LPFQPLLHAEPEKTPAVACLAFSAWRSVLQPSRNSRHSSCSAAAAFHAVQPPQPGFVLSEKELYCRFRICFVRIQMVRFMSICLSDHKRSLFAAMFSLFHCFMPKLFVLDFYSQFEIFYLKMTMF